MSEQYEISTRDYAEYVEELLQGESLSSDRIYGVQEEICSRIETLKAILEYSDKGDDGYMPRVHAMGYLRGLYARTDVAMKRVRASEKYQIDEKRRQEKKEARERHLKDVEEARRIKEERISSHNERERVLIASLRAEVGENRFLEIAEQVKMHHPV